MQPVDQFDVAIIGSGPGGYVCAIKAGQLGLKTVCIQKECLGGTCLNVGCIPSKTLLNITQKYDQARKEFKKMGIEIGQVNMNWEETQKKKEKIVKSLSEGIQYLFKKNNVLWVKGAAKFADQQTIQITNEKKSQLIKAKHIVIATGSKPIQFPSLPFDEKVVLSSTGALSLKNVPKTLAIIGGGYIGVELGSVYRRLGTEVTIIQCLDEICSTMDLQIANQLHQLLQKQGIKILTSHKVIQAKNQETHGEIVIQPLKGGEQSTIKADHILVCIGRKPNIENLQLQKANVIGNEKGRIVVDENLRTNIGNIYGIGDVVRGPMLAHKAEQQGIFVAEFIGGKVGSVKYNAIPSIIYTHPEVASVGQTEEELNEKNIIFKKNIFPFLANSRAIIHSQSKGFVKILANDKLLGVHIIGSNASEMIAQGVIGISLQIGPEQLGKICQGHPTFGQAFKEGCMGIGGKGINI